MPAKKVPLTFLGLITSGLIACSTQNDYEKYSSCLLDAMKGQDGSMKHHAEENCELKHPYETNIYWKNDIDIDFSFDPAKQMVLFKVNKNKSNYNVTKIEVSGNYWNCTNIPEEPKKPHFQLAFSYQEQAKAELGFTAQKLTLDNVDSYVEKQKLINDRADAIKSAEDQKKKLAYQADLTVYNNAKSSWSLPLEVKLKNGSGGVDLHDFKPVSSATVIDLRMWQRGPKCMRFLKVQGLRYR